MSPRVARLPSATFLSPTVTGSHSRQTLPPLFISFFFFCRKSRSTRQNKTPRGVRSSWAVIKLSQCRQQPRGCPAEPRSAPLPASLPRRFASQCHLRTVPRAGQSPRPSCPATPTAASCVVRKGPGAVPRGCHRCRGGSSPAPSSQQGQEVGSVPATAGKSLQGRAFCTASHPPPR